MTEANPVYTLPTPPTPGGRSITDEGVYLTTDGTQPNWAATSSQDPIGTPEDRRSGRVVLPT
jgi:hypothetical protein